MAEHCDDTLNAIDGKNLLEYAQDNSLKQRREWQQSKKGSLRRKRLEKRILRHPRLSPDQKKQALYFLFSDFYKDNFSITRNYIKLCLSEDYIKRGNAWVRHAEKKCNSPLV